MDQLVHVPQGEEIAFFYSLLRQDPDLLQAIDQKQFVDTPLHVAAAAGRTQLALEIQRLMPSFGTKLNPDGFSPIDLALRQGQVKTVEAMVGLNPELIGVQGREGITPLHYAAETGDVDILAGFLIMCPDSIKKLSVRKESAVHVVVMNGRLEALRVLLGWLKRTRRRGVLSWRDWEGNTALHLAASTNQPQAMELLLKERVVPINEKNSKGQTALDIVMQLPTGVNERALQILRCKRAKSASSIGQPRFASFADYLRSEITITEKIMEFIAYLQVGLRSDMRNIALVVAVLIVAATYQAALSPPGGSGNQTVAFIGNITSVPDKSHNTTAISTNTTSSIIRVDLLKTHEADDRKQAQMLKGDFDYFITLNSTALAASLLVIVLLLPFRSYNLLLHLSLIFLMLSYSGALDITSPPGTTGNGKMTWVTLTLVLIIEYLPIFILFRAVRTSRPFLGTNQFYNIFDVMSLVYCRSY